MLVEGRTHVPAAALLADADVVDVEGLDVLPVVLCRVVLKDAERVSQDLGALDGHKDRGLAVGKDAQQLIVGVLARARAEEVRTTRRMHLQHLAQQLVDSGNVLGTRSPDLN